MISVRSYVRWCFALKGQCHKIFCFRYFHESLSPKALKIHKLVDWQNLLHCSDLSHAGQFSDLGTQYFFAICGFVICWPKFIADLQLPQIWKFFIFLLMNTYLKCSNLNFYQIKNSAKQTCSWLLYSFAIKRGNFFKRCLILSVL